MNLQPAFVVVKEKEIYQESIIFCIFSVYQQTNMACVCFDFLPSTLLLCQHSLKIQGFEKITHLNILVYRLISVF